MNCDLQNISPALAPANQMADHTQ